MLEQFGNWPLMAFNIWPFDIMSCKVNYPASFPYTGEIYSQFIVGIVKFHMLWNVSLSEIEERF
jgi:hypothetical protein